jgi:heavy metal sensor kinase
LAGLLLLIAVMALSRVASNVRSNIDSELQSKGDQVVRLLELTVPSSPLSSLLVPTLNAVSEPEMYVQVKDNTRRNIHRSSNLGGVVIQFPESYFRQAMNGIAGYYNVSWVRPDDVRVYFAPVTFGGEVIATVQVARNLASEQTILNELSNNLFWIVAIALAAGAAIGYGLAGIALRPIQEATATALAITRTGRLDRRVPISSTRNDEIGRLISTFNEMLDGLEELFDKQRRFSGDISHELRSPLTTILGNIRPLKRADSLPLAERMEMQGEIGTEAERMNRLISDLLLLARADADPAIIRKQVELDTLLLEVYRHTMRRTDNSVEVRLLYEDQAIILGDAERLRQMLINLINNAIQYTAPGGQVDLSLERKEDQAQITVSDTGQGIAPEDLPHIFDRFYRTDKARSRAAGGTGLGLSIVKWVVDAHGGEIDVESELGKGTTFMVRLPLADTPATERSRQRSVRA